MGTQVWGWAWASQGPQGRGWGSRPSPVGLGFLALSTLSTHPFIHSLIQQAFLDIIMLVLGMRQMNETQFPASDGTPDLPQTGSPPVFPISVDGNSTLPVSQAKPHIQPISKSVLL